MYIFSKTISGINKMIKEKFKEFGAGKISLTFLMCLACCDATAVSIAEASELFRPQSNLVTGQLLHTEQESEPNQITINIDESVSQINRALAKVERFVVFMKDKVLRFHQKQLPKSQIINSCNDIKSKM